MICSGTLLGMILFDQAFKKRLAAFLSLWAVKTHRPPLHSVQSNYVTLDLIVSMMLLVIG
ncbi:MAG: hypothetical protein ACJAY2_000542 [Pseudomonadales bacterium]|jgi:hypothetical protein